MAMFDGQNGDERLKEIGRGRMGKHGEQKGNGERMGRWRMKRECYLEM